MRKTLFVILLLGALLGPAAAGERLVLVTSSYPPYVITGNGWPGLLHEIVTEAFAQQGMAVEIGYRPWRRCALLVQEGRAFAAFPYAATPARREYALFSDTLWTCRNVFFFLKGRFGDFDYTALKDLQEYTIAGTSGHYYEVPFRNAGLRVDYAPGEPFGLRKIWEMRCDFFAEDELVGWTLINRIFPTRKRMFGSTPTPWNLNPQHLMVSKKYPDAGELMARFNAGLAAIRKNGVYKKLVDKYLGGTSCPPQH